MSVKKSLRRRFVEKAVDHLPAYGKKVLLDKLIHDLGPDQVLRDVAMELEVTSCRFSGAWGAFEGDIRDTGVLFDYAKRKQWAPSSVSAVRQFFEGRSGTYLDIGANIGLTTIPIARNPRVRCECFEPEPRNFQYLRANLEYLGPFPNVRAHQVALFHSHDELEFELSSSNMGDHRLRQTTTPGNYGEETRQTVKVKAAPLDDLMADVSGPLAVKIDVQGAEAGVFAGGRSVLTRTELLTFEFWPYGLRRMGLGIDQILACLKHFKAAAIVEPEAEPADTLQTIEPIIDSLARRYATETGLAHVDVIARR